MQKNNRESNARYLGQVVGSAIIAPPEDQYQPTAALFVEETPQEPDPEELPDQNWAAQPTEYDPS